jgi:cyclic lactone autoinducer peptide
MSFFRGIVLTLAKVLAAAASLAAFTSNFTGCIFIYHQPKMPQRVRMMRG